MATLSPLEVSSQRKELRPVRMRHARQLLYSGIGERLITTSGRANGLRNKESVSEVTLLYPLRQRLGDMALHHQRNVQVDLGLTDPEHYTDVSAEFADACSAQTPAHALQIGRLEPVSPHGYRTDVYTLGVRYDNGALAPIDGFTEADMQLACAQLSELQAIAPLLPLLDEVTLAESTDRTGWAALAHISHEVYGSERYLADIYGIAY